MPERAAPPAVPAVAPVEDIKVVGGVAKIEAVPDVVTVTRAVSTKADDVGEEVLEEVVGEVQEAEDIEEVDGTEKVPEVKVPQVKGQSPIAHGTYENRKENEEDEEVIVKTEFVWADGAKTDVKLSGSWNGWMTIQMYHEGGGMWSVVTPVPVGQHEFKFVVDDEWRHSSRHPTVGDNPATTNNLRVVRGPPKSQAHDEIRESLGSAADAERNRAKKSCCIIC